MDFFNEIMKFGDIFESQETIDELKDISDEIKKYDVYDVLARISGLNLMPHNQNKSVLLDSLIADIICEEENTYNSTYKMSAGKFKKLIGKIRELNPGDVVNIPAGVKHWHGAAPYSWFSHVAVEVPGTETKNEWCEPVSDEDYRRSV